MLKIFNLDKELPKEEKLKIRSQKLDGVTKQCNHNYRNFYPFMYPQEEVI